MIVSRSFLSGAGTTLGIDDPTPYLAWKLTSTTAGDKQTAYEVQVGTTVGGSDVLATGKVVSTEQMIELRASLKSATQYFWRVRAWDNADVVSNWKADTFETGLWALADWRRAAWIGLAGTPAPQLRKAFTTTKPVAKARLYVAAGGYAESHVNGVQASLPLEPGITNYDERVQYTVHDVTAQVVTGANAVTLTLGRGFYGCTTVTDWSWHNAPWHGAPRALVLLLVTYTDGEQLAVTSDATWKAITGPTTADSAYLGDSYDARLETAGWQAAGFVDTAWSAAQIMSTPKGAIVAQSQPPIVAHATLAPNETVERVTGVWRYRFPKLIAGWARLTITAAAGTVVTITYAEKLNGDGTLYTTNSAIQGGTPQVDRFIAKGGTQVWEPRFSYKGFAYVEVTGVQPDAIVAVPIWSDLEETSTWSSSNSLLDQLYGMALQSVRINSHGILTDTPMYERNGWLGDANVMAGTVVAAFGAHAFFKKWLLDMADDLNEAGNMHMIVPSAGFAANIKTADWESALVLITHKVWKRTGDLAMVAQLYPYMKRYVDSWLTTSSNLFPGEYGDWSSPAGNYNEGGKELSNAAMVFAQTKALAEMATALGQAATAAAYLTRCDAIATDMTARLMNATTGVYLPALAWAGEMRQTPTVLALAHGFVPAGKKAAAAAALEENVRVTKSNHTSCGILGNEHLLAVLTENGYVDTALAVILQTTYPSWGQWAVDNATTTWNGFGTRSAIRSLSHHMHGSYAAWMLRYLTGINVVSPSAVVIDPYVPAALAWCEATVETMRGPVTVRRDGTTLTVTIPPGLSATRGGVAIPSGVNTITL